jgi:hypothetical protein
VVRLGHTTFFQRARRKLGVTDSAGIAGPSLTGIADAGGVAESSATANGGHPNPEKNLSEGVTPHYGVAFPE